MEITITNFDISITDTKFKDIFLVNPSNDGSGVFYITNANNFVISNSNFLLYQVGSFDSQL